MNAENKDTAELLVVDIAIGWPHKEPILKAINKALETARAEVREECAKSVMQGIQPGECYGINTFKDKADKIRAGETKP